jgi:hypothetical protein
MAVTQEGSMWYENHLSAFLIPERETTFVLVELYCVTRLLCRTEAEDGWAIHFITCRLSTYI